MRVDALLPCLLLAATAAAQSPDVPARQGAPDGPPPHHAIEVTLDPATSTVAGTDRLTLRWRKEVALDLHEGFSLEATCAGQPLPLRHDAATPARWTARPPRACRDADGNLTMDLRFSGIVNDPVEAEPSVHFVTGDRTNGLVTSDGAFLAGGTLWYPETGDLALFDLAVEVPPTWSVASQGMRLVDAQHGDDGADGRRRFRFEASIPSDGLALSAGPYEVKSRQVEGVTISTYFFAEHAPAADMFLDAASSEIARLVSRLGAYPGLKFDIVENFFTTGYGFPTYTLLGKDVIAMGSRALRPGYLDHEIAHVWFGNHVSVDLSQGNWCEGLTSYVTNYLNTAKDGDAAALAYRQRVSLRYSLDVPVASDAPPAKFVTKTDDGGASIGYGKVSMVFHLLERDLGEDALWAALRDFVERYGGKRASWDDLRSCFERACGHDLRAFFDQWIGRAGLPELHLADVKEDGGVVTGTIAQPAQPPWRVDLDVVATLADGRAITQRVASSGAATPFTIAAGGSVARVDLDPAFDVARRIGRAELPPCLARTLADENLLVVLPVEPADDEGPEAKAWWDALKDVVTKGAGPKAFVTTVDKLGRGQFDSGSSLFIAGTESDPETPTVGERFLEPLGVDVRTPRSFRAGTRRWRSPSQAILASIDNPDSPGKTLTLLVPNATLTADAARFMFFHENDTWVVLDGGRAQERATIWPSPSSTSVVLHPPDPPATAGGRMLESIKTLVAPANEGRDPMAPTGDRSARVVSSLLSAAVGHDVERFPVAFTVRDAPGRPCVRVTPEGKSTEEYLPIIPAHAWLPDESPTDAMHRLGVPVPVYQIPVVMKFPRGVMFLGGPHPSFAGIELRDTLPVILDDGSDGTLERIASAIDEAKLHNATALLVLRPDAPWPGDPDLSILPSKPSPHRAERMARNPAVLGPTADWRAAAGELARARLLPRNGDFPLYFAGRELADALDRVGGLTPGRRSWDGWKFDLAVGVTRQHVHDTSFIARIPGRNAAGGMVMLSAHHDGLGEGADGSFLECAVDNGAGVAAVLEVARRLVADPAAKTVIVALMGAEEWGLRGSRAVVEDWKSQPDKPSIVVNVDSVGQAGQPFHVIGRTRLPDVAAVLENAARAQGLAIGDDIDKYADREGSDHWSWVEDGVPAVDVFQADYAIINTEKDTIDKVDPATLEKVADALEASVRKLAE